MELACSHSKYVLFLNHNVYDLLNLCSMPGTRDLLPRGLLGGASFIPVNVRKKRTNGGTERQIREAIKTKENRGVGAILMNTGHGGCP